MESLAVFFFRGSAEIVKASKPGQASIGHQQKIPG